jgi:hypothetical protein
MRFRAGRSVSKKFKSDMPAGMFAYRRQVVLDLIGSTFLIPKKRYDTVEGNFRNEEWWGVTDID